MFRPWILLLFTLGCLTVPAQLWAGDWDVLPEVMEQGPTDQMLARHLHRQATAAMDRRTDEYEKLKTPEEIAAYQARLKALFWQRLGEMPERTPLDAQTLSQVEVAGVQVERILFESRPRHYVTGLLYLPQGKTPSPGVIVPCGHAPNGKGAAAYQRFSILLAQHGIAAFCYDPIGQGERYQILDAQGRPPFNCTTEHTLVGVGSILVGRNTASYRVWDGIRALDFLAQRPEIDETKLGCAGNSGGGTLTEYLMALDDRVVCAAPSCCVTTFRRRLQTIGPGDAEQNIFGQIAAGLDHADYTLIRAPRPTLLCAATHDFVDITGSWDIFREAKRLYTRMGYAERVDLIEVDGKHGLSQLKREAIVQWMRRWLLGIDQPIRETEFDVLSTADARCTKQGQVQLLPDALSVMDLNLARAEQFADARRKTWQPKNRQQATAKVRELAGIRPLEKIPQPLLRVLGTVARENQVAPSGKVEKLLLQPEPGILLPALLFRPEKPNGRRLLYLHGDGKSAAFAEQQPVAKLVDSGVTVLAVDLRGTGETGPSSNNQWGGSWDDFFLSYLLGKSLLGLRTEDALLSARWLARLADQGLEPSKTPAPVEVIGVGTAGPIALHAVALEPSLFSKATLRECQTTWLTAITEPATQGQMVNVVHGALEHYDLQDLIQSLPAGVIELAK